MITGQKPIKKSKQGQFQIIDVVKLFSPICKISKQIVNANAIPSIVCESFRVAEEERPGAVLLELPEDIAAELADTSIIAPHPRFYAVASDAVLENTAALIKAAKHPLILLGAAANRKHSRRAISDFIRETCIPFFVTQMGKGVVDESSELFLGTAALTDHDYLHQYIHHADLIINIGHDVVEKPPFLMEHGGQPVVHINYKSAQVDQVYFPQTEVIGDIAATLEKLTPLVAGAVEFELDTFRKVRDQVAEKTQEGATDGRFPVTPQRLVADVRQFMGYHDIIALDNGIYKLWFARNYSAYQPNTVLLDNALATMGAGLPSAMMAALLHPEQKVMAICGDGGFMMNSQEIETAIRLKLNLVVLVLNDSSYGMIRWKQAVAGFDDWGLEFGNPDFVKYVESYGGHGHRIDSADSLIPTFEKAFRQGGVHLIDIPVDYSENKKVLIDELAKFQKH
jgi:acetolactate synthase-1/2/3 large subunit